MRIEFANNYGKCAYFMPLYNAMLCFARSSFLTQFLAKPCQPNRHDDQMARVDPLEGHKSDTLTTHGNP